MQDPQRREPGGERLRQRLARDRAGDRRADLEIIYKGVLFFVEESADPRGSADLEIIYKDAIFFVEESADPRGSTSLKFPR